ncbi:MAG: MFS transporter [Solibacillus sp.]
MQRISMQKVKLIFLVVAFFLWLPHFLYLYVLTPYVAQLGGSYYFIGVILGSYGIMQLLFRIPIGVFSDLLNNRKLFIVLGMATSLISCVLYVTFDSMLAIFMARLLAGVAASSWVAFTVLYQSYFLQEDVHSAMGSLTFVLVNAQFIGMLCSGIIVEHYGWQMPFLLSVLFSVVGFIFSLFIVEEKQERQQGVIQFERISVVLKEPFLQKMAILSILAHAIIFSTMFGFTSQYALSFGFTKFELSLLVIAFMLPHALVSLVIGRYIIPKWGSYTSLLFAFFVTFISVLVMPIVTTKLAFLGIQIVSGLALGLIFPILLALATKNIVSENRATAMGMYQAVYALGIFIGPFTSGLINANWGITYTFYLSAIIALVGMLLILKWKRSF